MDGRVGPVAWRVHVKSWLDGSGSSGTAGKRGCGRPRQQVVAGVAGVEAHVI